MGTTDWFCSVVNTDHPSFSIAIWDDPDPREIDSPDGKSDEDRSAKLRRLEQTLPVHHAIITLSEENGI